jgi:hypothetical protein
MVNSVATGCLSSEYEQDEVDLEGYRLCEDEQDGVDPEIDEAPITEDDQGERALHKHLR